MPILALAFLVVVVLLVLRGGSSKPSVGYDVSYPQCSGSHPSNPLFGIVGVNGGTARTANPCLGKQVRWALRAPGQASPKQVALSFYIDTGDPGTKASDWPTSGTAGDYGSCNGLLTNACSYLYGQQRAAQSFQLAVAADSTAAAKTAPWWLDVELLESWSRSYQLNIAALQGFLAGLRGAGVTGTIGIYSTSEQWREITGLNASTTTQAFNLSLPDWIAGTQADLAQAQARCTGGGFTGETPTLAQYQTRGFDADLRCGDDKQAG